MEQEHDGIKCVAEKCNIYYSVASVVADMIILQAGQYIFEAYRTPKSSFYFDQQSHLYHIRHHADLFDWDSSLHYRLVMNIDVDLSQYGDFTVLTIPSALIPSGKIYDDVKAGKAHSVVPILDNGEKHPDYSKTLFEKGKPIVVYFRPKYQVVVSSNSFINAIERTRENQERADDFVRMANDFSSLQSNRYPYLCNIAFPDIVREIAQVAINQFESFFKLQFMTIGADDDNE